MRRRDEREETAGPGRLGLALVLGASACAVSHGTAYDAAVGSAARNEGAGRFAAAAEDYDRAALAGTRERDQDQARWDAAEATAHAGNVAGAASRYEAIAGDGASEHQAEAAFRLATLRIESGDPDRGWQDMEQIPRRFSTHGVAHVAVRKLVQHADEQGTRAGLDELRALERDLGSTELVQLVTYLDATHVEALGDDRAAREAYGRIADRWPYPFGSLLRRRPVAREPHRREAGPLSAGDRRSRADAPRARDDEHRRQLRAREVRPRDAPRRRAIPRSTPRPREGSRSVSSPLHGLHALDAARPGPVARGRALARGRRRSHRVRSPCHARGAVPGQPLRAVRPRAVPGAHAAQRQRRAPRLPRVHRAGGGPGARGDDGGRD